MSFPVGNSPLVSIIIPVLSFDAALGETLRSLSGQEAELHEVLVQHGGIGDTNPQVDTPTFRLRIESAPDGGIYYAINRAVERAGGRYVLVLGAGDTLRPGVLRDLQPVFETDPPFDAVYGDVWMKDRGNRYGGAFQAEDFFRHNICQQGLFYQRKTLLEMDGFNPRYPTLSDYELNVRLFSRPGARIHYEPVIISDYLGGGLSSRAWREDPWIAERENVVAKAFGISKPKRDPRGNRQTQGESPPFSE